MSDKNDLSDSSVASQKPGWLDMMDEQDAKSAERLVAQKAAIRRKYALKDGKSAKKAKPVKKVYPPTEYESELADRLEGHAEMIAEKRSGMQERTGYFFRSMLAEARRTAEGKAAYLYRQWEEFCESEIEKIFLLALIARSQDDHTLRIHDPEDFELDPYTFMTTKMLDFLDWHVGIHGPDLAGILMQVPIRGYRVDFVIYGIMADEKDQENWKRVPLIIECDGHDFHERTKEQAKRDRQRDRALLAEGYHVMRFTGAEIWRDPHACVDEALTFIHRRLGKLSLQRLRGGAGL